MIPPINNASVTTKHCNANLFPVSLDILGKKLSFYTGLRLLDVKPI